jgi:hypothetical protein
MSSKKYYDKYFDNSILGEIVWCWFNDTNFYVGDIYTRIY